jgi:hypothetical protein
MQPAETKTVQALLGWFKSRLRGSQPRLSARPERVQLEEPPADPLGQSSARALPNPIATDDFAFRKARHDRLVTIHTKAISFIQFEARLVLDRTSTYLVSTSFLLAAYGVSLSAESITSVLVPPFGLVLSAIHPFLIARTIRALEFWRSTGALVESDEDYWFPARIDNNWTPTRLGEDFGRSDQDLDFLVARQRWNRGRDPRQAQVSMSMGRPPGFVMKNQARVPDPNTIFSTWLPMLFGTLWVIALAVAIWTLLEHDDSIEPAPPSTITTILNTTVPSTSTTNSSSPVATTNSSAPTSTSSSTAIGSRSPTSTAGP